MTPELVPRHARVFIALPLAGEAHTEAVRVIASLRRLRDAETRLRWVRPESLHVTLRFLGEVSRPKLPALIDALAGQLASQRSFVAHLGPLHAFPSATRARVVALALLPEESIARLAAAADRAAIDAGFVAETRRFRSHVTLARVRMHHSLDPALLSGVSAGGATMSADAVVLFESRLGAGGSQYVPLARFPLAACANEPVVSCAPHERVSAPLLHPH